MAVVQIKRIVVASPSDVQAERNALATVVEELNNGIARDGGLRLELARWETDAYPGFHPEGPQGLIDAILRIDDCDVLIGIFWKRFGTPVRDAQSGTEHEFRRAYESWQQHRRPQIMMYFNQRAYTPKSSAEVEQWGQVLAFRENFPEEGLWWPYSRTGEFERLVRGHLTQFFRQHSAPPVHHQIAPVATPPTQPKEHPDLSRQHFEPEMLLIPAGEFLMGSDPQKDRDAEDNEQPQHRLYLPTYYLAKTPVTNTYYAYFVEQIGRPHARPPSGKEDHPAVLVSWYDALAYCRWLSEMTGKAYSLPSEAEWEKGARGADGRIFPWGNQLGAGRCNFLLGDDTAPVAAHPTGASPYGVLDMAGNVWEWTRSLWGFHYPYDPRDGRDNLDAASDLDRVIRGGAFWVDYKAVRCAWRGKCVPHGGGRDIGFRVVMHP